MAHKTLYLLEELDDVAVHTSKLKEVVSMDDGRARALYGDNQTIERIGHLMINANNAPNLGEDPAVWNRAIYIPWDAKYIGESDGPINPSKGIFRQDYSKKNELVELSSAFMTVCLMDFTNYIKANPGANSFRVPFVVKHLIHSEKEKINPIPVFIDLYLFHQTTFLPSQLTLQEMHTAFHGFCRLRYIKNNMDYTAFADKVGRTNIEIVSVNGKEPYVKDYYLTEQGKELYKTESSKRGIISADNMDIPHLFKRQRLEL